MLARAMAARARHNVAAAALVTLAPTAAAAGHVTRPLLPSDVPSMAGLIHSDGIGWGQTEDDLLTLFRADNSVFLGAFDESTNELLSMAGLPAHGTCHRWSWLCYVVTAPSAQRRGLATDLLNALFANAPSNVPIGLYGSPAGAPMYAAKFGFTDRGTAHLVSLSRTVCKEGASEPTAAAAAAADQSAGTAPLSVVPLSAERLPEIATLDAYACCVQRPDALAAWAKAVPGAGI